MALKLEIQRNTECLLEAIAAVLSFRGQDGALLVDHACVPWLDDRSHPPAFHAFDLSHVFAGVERWSGIRLSLTTAADWGSFLDSIRAGLAAGEPAVVFADTFFVFPKKIAHENHVLVVTGIDPVRDAVHLVSSADGERILPLGQFRVAAVSNVMEGRRSYQRLELTGGEGAKAVSLAEAVQAHRRALRVGHPGLYAATALRRFAPVLESSLNQTARPSAVSEEWFRRLRPFEFQKKRLAALLSRHLSEKHPAAAAVKRVANHWEVLRSLCLKRSLTTAVPVDAIMGRFQKIADAEDECEAVLEASLQ